MTDRELLYKQLSERPIESDGLAFHFIYPENNISIGDFYITKGNEGKFSSTYLINLIDDKIIVRLHTVSGSRKLELKSNNTKSSIKIGVNWLECQIQDILSVLEYEKWEVKLFE